MFKKKNSYICVYWDYNLFSKPAVETPYMQQIEKEIIIQDLVDEKPSEKIVLDIQDTRRYFESQTRGSDEVNISKEVNTNETTQSLMF